MIVMGPSKTIHMFVSISEITMTSLGGFTHGSILCHYTNRNAQAFSTLKTASHLSQRYQFWSLPSPLQLLDTLYILISYLP